MEAKNEGKGERSYNQRKITTQKVEETIDGDGGE